MPSKTSMQMTCSEPKALNCDACSGLCAIATNLILVISEASDINAIHAASVENGSGRSVTTMWSESCGKQREEDSSAKLASKVTRRLENKRLRTPDAAPKKAAEYSIENLRAGLRSRRTECYNRYLTLLKLHFLYTNTQGRSKKHNHHRLIVSPSRTYTHAQRKRPATTSVDRREEQRQSEGESTTAVEPSRPLAR